MEPLSKVRRAARSPGAATIAIVGLALVLRLLVIAADGDYRPNHDSFDYDRHARSIAAGDGFPTSGYATAGGPSALRAPAYPYALGAAYAAGGGVNAGRALGACLGALTVLLTIGLGTRLGGRSVGLVAGLLAALFPPLVLLSRDLYSELLFIPLVLAVPLAVIHFRDHREWRWLLAIGALCGLAGLTRSPGPALLIPAMLGVWVLTPRVPVRELFTLDSLARPLAVLGVAIIVIAPWTLRNSAEFGRFIPVVTSSGFALSGTYNETSADDPEHPTAWRTPEIVRASAPLFQTPGVDEGTLDSELRSRALDYAWSHPTYVAEVIQHNLARLTLVADDAVVGFDGPVTERGIGSGSATAERVALALLAPFAMIGAVVIIRNARSRAREGTNPRNAAGVESWFVWLIPALLVLAAALVAGLPRYRTPIDPFLVLLAAFGLRWAVTVIKRRHLAAVGTALAAALMLTSCGGGDEPDGPDGQTSAADPEITRATYIDRADKICAQALADTERILQRALTQGDRVETISELTTEGLVKPGLEVRRRMARRLQALPAPPPDPDLEDYLRLFSPLEELTRQRIEAGRAEDRELEVELETRLVALAREQQAAAAAYGFNTCATDFAEAAIPASGGP